MKWSRMLLTLILAFNSTACVLLKTDERIDVMVAATDLGAGRAGWGGAEETDR